jgi:hypothetical protein
MFHNFACSVSNPTTSLEAPQKGKYTDNPNPI